VFLLCCDVLQILSHFTEKGRCNRPWPNFDRDSIQELQEWKRISIFSEPIQLQDMRRLGFESGTSGRETDLSLFRAFTTSGRVVWDLIQGLQEGKRISIFSEPSQLQDVSSGIWFRDFRKINQTCCRTVNLVSRYKSYKCLQVSHWTEAKANAWKWDHFGGVPATRSVPGERLITQLRATRVIPACNFKLAGSVSTQFKIIWVRVLHRTVPSIQESGLPNSQYDCTGFLYGHIKLWPLTTLGHLLKLFTIKWNVGMAIDI